MRVKVQIVTDLDICTGNKAMDLIPKYEDIPEEFKRQNNKWVKVVDDWFFKGLKNCKWTPKEGIDTNKALKHVAAVMGSFRPKHEHKTAGCAYLLSEFFEDVDYN